MKNKKNVLIMAFACILIGGALMAISRSAINLNDDKAYNENVVYASFKNLDVTNTSWNLTVESDDVSATTIEVKGDESFVPTFYIRDNTLYVDLSFNESWWNITSFLLGAEVKIIVPAKQYGDIHIVSTSGSVNVEDINASSMTISTTSGRVKVEEVNVANMFKTTTTSGTISFDDFDAGSINIHTTSGRVSGSVKTPKVFETKTSSGSVKVPATGTGGACYILTTSGSINVSID